MRVCVRSVILLALSLAAHGQTSIEEVIRNTGKLEVRVSLDRAVYFPGERASIMLLVRNPTSGPLLVLEPFNAITGLFDLVKQTGTDYELVRESPHRPLPNVPPTTILNSGSELTLNLESTQTSVFGYGVPVMGSTGVPSVGGDYALSYSYNPSRLAEFTVVVPTLDAAAVIRVADEEYTNSVTHQTKMLERYMHIFALRWENLSYVCVTTAAGSVDRAAAGDPETGAFEGPQVGAYRRLAGQTSSLRIVSISGTADPNGNLNVVWRDSGGTDHNVYIPKP